MTRHSKEELSQAFDRAPKIIQDALSDGPAIDFMIGLQKRYELHVDVSGNVVERIRDLLLGLSNPTEFLGELIQLGISDTVARTIVGDLNKEVFIPLRERMQKEPKASPAAKAPEPIAVPQQSLGSRNVIPAPSLDYEPAPTLPGSPVPAPMPTAPAPAPAESSPVPAVETPLPVAHTPHPMPVAAPQQGWHSAAAVHIYVPSHGTPYQAPAATPIEKVVDIEEEPPTAPTVPPPTTPPPAPPTPKPPSPPLQKDYVADPYREPV